MNTYNIKVNGNTIVEKISQENLEFTLNQIRGLVWTSGGNNENISVVLNKNENPLQ